MPGGELAPGDWGEGFVDRRHPAHLSFTRRWRGTGTCSAPQRRAGRAARRRARGSSRSGPTIRWCGPFVRFPVNHHWAQILERALLAARRAARAGGARGRGLQRRRAGEPVAVAQLRAIRRLLGRAGIVLAPAGARAAGLVRRGGVARAPAGSRPRSAEVERVGPAGSGAWVRSGSYALAEWARTEEGGDAFDVRLACWRRVRRLWGRHRHRRTGSSAPAGPRRSGCSTIRFARSGRTSTTTSSARRAGRCTR